MQLNTQTHEFNHIDSITIESEQTLTSVKIALTKSALLIKILSPSKLILIRINICFFACLEYDVDFDRHWHSFSFFFFIRTAKLIHRCQTDTSKDPSAIMKQNVPNKAIRFHSVNLSPRYRKRRSGFLHIKMKTVHWLWHQMTFLSDEHETFLHVKVDDADRKMCVSI